MIDLRLGDCLELLPTLADRSVHLTVTSPPYDNLRTYNGNDGGWGSAVWEPLLADLFRVTRDGGVVVWIVADATINGSETGSSFMQALHAKRCGFNLHDTMIWEKPTFTATGALRTRYAQVFEYMFVFTKGKPRAFNPIKDRPTKGPRKKSGTIRQADGSTKPQSSIGRVYSSKEAQRFNVWRINTECSNKKRVHPAQFPEQIARDHIISWSNPGDVVLDPFMGSGTTGVVCRDTGRSFIGIEKDAAYFTAAQERIGTA